MPENLSSYVRDTTLAGRAFVTEFVHIHVALIVASMYDGNLYRLSGISPGTDASARSYRLLEDRHL